jgi:hypothetical protein
VWDSAGKKPSGLSNVLISPTNEEWEESKAYLESLFMISSFQQVEKMLLM